MRLKLTNYKELKIMADINQLLNDITNTEITKNELQRQLDILTKEYEMETKELQRLNDKNMEYKQAYSKQENQKRLSDESEKRQQGQQDLKNIINEIGKGIR